MSAKGQNYEPLVDRKPNPTCCVTVLRIFALASCILAFFAAVVVVYSTRAYTIDLDTATSEGLRHPGYLEYISLHLDCDQVSKAAQEELLSVDYKYLVRSQCGEKQFPYIFVTAWASFTLILASLCGFVAIFSKVWTPERNRFAIIVTSMAIVSLAIALYYGGSAYGNLNRLVRCEDFDVIDVAKIKLDKNYCITESGKPSISTAVDLERYFEIFFAGITIAFVAAMTLIITLSLLECPCGTDYIAKGPVSLENEEQPLRADEKSPAEQKSLGKVSAREVKA